MYSNKILNFQESTTILNACTKKCLEPYQMHHVECHGYTKDNIGPGDWVLPPSIPIAASVHTDISFLEI